MGGALGQSFHTSTIIHLPEIILVLTTNQVYKQSMEPFCGGREGEHYKDADSHSYEEKIKCKVSEESPENTSSLCSSVNKCTIYHKEGENSTDHTNERRRWISL